MKKYYPEDFRFLCDCCGKECEDIHYDIQNKDESYLFCCKRCLEKFVEKYRQKKYPKPKMGIIKTRTRGKK